jgi:hypothetical protein
VPNHNTTAMTMSSATVSLSEARARTKGGMGTPDGEHEGRAGRPTGRSIRDSATASHPAATRRDRGFEASPWCRRGIRGCWSGSSGGRDGTSVLAADDVTIGRCSRSRCRSGDAGALPVRTPHSRRGQPRPPPRGRCARFGSSGQCGVGMLKQGHAICKPLQDKQLTCI